MGTCWINIGDTIREGRSLLIPQRLALALENAGWIIRAEIIIEKNNPAPYRHVSFRRSHETLLVAALNTRHYLDADTMRVDKLVRFVKSIGAEEVFAEAVNPRGSGLKLTEETLRANGYAKEAEAVAGIRKRANWSHYVAALIGNIQAAVRRHMSIRKLRFLLYPTNLTEQDEAAIRKDGAGVIWL